MESKSTPHLWVPGAVESQLTEVQQIVSSQGAFVARRADGTVVAWGNRRHGGEIPEELHAALLHVQDLAATDFAFAAICGPERTVPDGDFLEVDFRGLG